MAANSSGFIRVRLFFDYPPPAMVDCRMCWLVVDLKTCRVVADLESVIRDKFELSSRSVLSLFVEDCYLPHTEHIFVVRDNDSVRVKVDYLPQVNGHSSPPDTSSKKCKKRQRPKEDDGPAGAEVSVDWKEKKRKKRSEHSPDGDAEQAPDEKSSKKSQEKPAEKKKRKKAKEKSPASPPNPPPSPKQTPAGVEKKKKKPPAAQEKKQSKKPTVSSSDSSSSSEEDEAPKPAPKTPSSTSASSKAPPAVKPTPKTPSSTSASSKAPPVVKPTPKTPSSASASSKAPPVAKPTLKKTQPASSSSSETDSSSDEAPSVKKAPAKLKPSAPLSSPKSRINDHSKPQQASAAPRPTHCAQAHAAAPPPVGAVAEPCDADEEIKLVIRKPMLPPGFGGGDVRSPWGDRTRGKSGPGGQGDRGRGVGRGVFRGEAGRSEFSFNGSGEPSYHTDSLSNKSVVVQNGAERGPKQDYSTLPLLAAPPQVGRRIAFKLLELGENYTPEISEYKEGTIVSVDLTTKQIELKLLHVAQAPVEPGKFDLVYSNPDGSESVEYAVTRGAWVTERWDSLLEPRLII